MTLIPTRPLANLRDLGGIPVAGGRVRPSVLFRSDDVALVDEPGAHALVESGVSLVIDLRSHGETTQTGRGLLAGHPVDYLHLPLTDDVSTPGAELVGLFSASSDPAVTMGEWYAQLLEERTAAVLDGLRAIAANPGGSLFHCAAGKDRTGIFAASLLDVLGARDDDIVADYARTEGALEAIRARFHERHPGSEQARAWGQLPRVLMSAPRAAMTAMLATVRERHGSVRDLLARAGYDDALATQLRGRVVEPS